MSSCGNGIEYHGSRRCNDVLKALAQPTEWKHVLIGVAYRYQTAEWAFIFLKASSR